MLNRTAVAVARLQSNRQIQQSCRTKRVLFSSSKVPALEGSVKGDGRRKESVGNAIQHSLASVRSRRKRWL